jgi:proline iminopeptidase
MRERPTLLVLHGGPGFDHTSFKPAFSQMADVAQVVYLDQRGQGRSDRSTPDRWTLDAWADDIPAFCDAVGIEHPVVLGWSWGGMIAARYAGRYPDHPAKLILQCTMARLDIETVMDKMRRLGGDDAAQAARAFWVDGSPEGMAAYAQHCLPLYSAVPLSADNLTRAALNPDLLLGGPRLIMAADTTADLAKVACPTLVVAGEDDPICPVEAAEEIVKSLPQDKVRFERIPGARHYPHEDRPDRLFEVLRSFLLEAA